MDKQREHHNHTQDALPHAYRGYDPLQASWNQTGRFNRAWLKNGERLTLLQRSGYAALSLLFVACGLYLLQCFILFFRSRDWIFVLIFGGAAFFFIIAGVKGLGNVLRFPPRS